MNAVEINNLSVQFDDFIAVNDVSLDIKEGMIYGLLGPNGAGKTTIIRTLSTLLEPTDGTVKIFGIDVTKDPEEVRRNIGLAGQYAAIDESLTGMQNLEMIGRLYHLPKKLIKQRATETLERLSLVDAAHKRVNTYSGGMRRRLDLGASLIGHAKFVMLDEPTTGLDPRTRNELWSLIREIQKEGATILLTTQYLDEADALAETIGIIDRGSKVAEGTSTSLKNRLGGSIIEFSVKSKKDRIMKLVPNAELNELTQTWRLKSGNNDAQELVELANIFVREKIEVEELGIQRPSLDDVFLELTGHGAIDQSTKATNKGKKGKK